jgi:leucyl aminopeptidase
MKNAGTKIGDAPSALAATFLYDNLVGAGFKSDNWIHIDIASVVDSGDRATGYGVGLLTQLVKSI